MQFIDGVRDLLIDPLFNWILGQGHLGIVIFVGVYTLATIVFVPASPLTIWAGANFGVVQGTAVVFTGAMLGAVLAFCISRRFAYHYVRKWLVKKPRFEAMQRAIATQGFKIIFLARLSPLFPFELFNYFLGVTSVSLRDYTLGTLGIFPGILMYAYLGSLGADLTKLRESSSTLSLLLQIMGFVTTVVVTLYGTRVARKALREAMHQQP